MATLLGVMMSPWSAHSAPEATIPPASAPGPRTSARAKAPSAKQMALDEETSAKQDAAAKRAASKAQQARPPVDSDGPGDSSESSSDSDSASEPPSDDGVAGAVEPANPKGRSPLFDSENDSDKLPLKKWLLEHALSRLLTPLETMGVSAVDDLLLFDAETLVQEIEATGFNLLPVQRAKLERAHDKLQQGTVEPIAAPLWPSPSQKSTGEKLREIVGSGSPTQPLASSRLPIAPIAKSPIQSPFAPPSNGGGGVACIVEGLESVQALFSRLIADRTTTLASIEALLIQCLELAKIAPIAGGDATLHAEQLESFLQSKAASDYTPLMDGARGVRMKLQNVIASADAGERRSTRDSDYEAEYRRALRMQLSLHAPKSAADLEMSLEDHSALSRLRNVMQSKPSSKALNSLYELAGTADSQAFADEVEKISRDDEALAQLLHTQRIIEPTGVYALEFLNSSDPEEAKLEAARLVTAARVVQRAWFNAEAKILSTILPENATHLGVSLTKAAWFGTMIGGAKDNKAFKLTELTSTKNVETVSGKDAEDSQELWLCGMPACSIALQDAHPYDRTIRTVMAQVQVVCNSCVNPHEALGVIFGALLTTYQTACNEFQTTPMKWPTLAVAWEEVQEVKAVKRVISQSKASSDKTMAAMEARIKQLEGRKPKKTPGGEPLPSGGQKIPPDPNSKRSLRKKAFAEMKAAAAALANGGEASIVDVTPAEAPAQPAQQTAQSKLTFAAAAKGTPSK
jgi:hypothetical protein